MKRIDATKNVVENRFGIPVNVFANAEVNVEDAAVQELNALLALQETLEKIRGADKISFPPSRRFCR